MRWSVGAIAALGIGLGAALAASMGSAGFALGLGIVFAFYGIQRLRRRQND